MRILWSSNIPIAGTGYGVQTKQAIRNLPKLGHDIAVFAFWGLKGGLVDWEVPIYPNEPGDYGIQDAPLFMEHFQADILITLVDVWVLGGLSPNIKWVPWLPIDHDPAPPQVVEVVKRHPGLVKGISQSLFGQRKLGEKGVDVLYIPNDFDTSLYSPKPHWRRVSRSRYKWEDKFVVGTVGTNHTERKNWTVAFKAMRRFVDAHPNEVIWYLHTNPMDERGINLLALRENLGMEKVTFFPSRIQLKTGIDEETMSRMYNGLDVFLLPTKGEGFCRPLVEAQLCNVPVITTKCTSHEEVVGGGWFIENLIPVWTLQSSWQFDCHEDEVLEKLELAYKAKKDGSITQKQRAGRKHCLQYDQNQVYPRYWAPILIDVEKRLKEPRSLEGVQHWRLILIPKTCVPRKVLDIGCGVTQPYKSHLEHLGQYVGVDVKEGPNVMKADAHDLPFGDKEFGFVWMSELLEHVDDPKKVLAEAQRVGVHGVCLFSTPMNPYFKGDPDHKIVKIPHTVTAGGDGLISW